MLLLRLFRQWIYWGVFLAMFSSVTLPAAGANGFRPWSAEGSPNLPSAPFKTFLPSIFTTAKTTPPGVTPTPGPNPTPTPTAVPPGPPPSGGDGWNMVAGNVERTSWVPESVSGNLHLEWYRPIEAYISQNVQIIAARGMLYVATANGLLALNASTGEVVWRFDTELPLGNSPTVVDTTLYVGGYDRKLHVLNATTGQHLWDFEGALAGYSANPLVVNGRVYAANRDGYLYAIGAQGTPQQGQLIWKFHAGGPINLSPAYKDGVIYFAAEDNYAYAVRADTGAQAWKSQKLPGDGYGSYWPVIYADKVIFSGQAAYRLNSDPGVSSLDCPPYNPGEGPIPCDAYVTLENYDLFYDRSTLGTLSRPTQGWAQGFQVFTADRLFEYLENNPDGNAHLHKPWRRTMIVLNRSDGSEFTLDHDQDGKPEYAPFIYWASKSGNIYPPVIGQNGVLYANNPFENNGQGKVMGWILGSGELSLVGGQGARDEPQALSLGGNTAYRDLCCDRVGDWFSYTTPNSSGRFWDYSLTLADQAPGYDQMWWGTESNSLPRLEGNYGTKNGVYHNHGDQNPLIPYQGRVYAHRSNAIVAYGTGPARGKLPLVPIQTGGECGAGQDLATLKNKLEGEVQKMVNAGHLRPGYYNAGQFSQFFWLNNYFENPGDTLGTLARAYPYLSAGLQAQVKTYLKSEYNAYFSQTMYARIGFADGAPRETLPMPPEISAVLPNFKKDTWAGNGWPWSYPQKNFYDMWKYALIFPEDAAHLYDQAKSKLEVPATASDSDLQRWPHQHNGYIAGYIGFLKLQELAGKTTADAALRTEVTNELNRLLQLRANNFTKDSYWLISDTEPSHGGDYHNRAMNLATNFYLMTPEEGDYLNQHALSKVQAALSEYQYDAPYWFVARYDAAVDEGAMGHLYNYPALFQARAFILKETREQLSRFLDVPAFGVGDLFYLQNLIAAIEAN